MKAHVRVHVAAIDGDCGTLTEAFATEVEAYKFVIHNLRVSDHKKAINKLLKKKAFGELDDLLREHCDPMDTWSIEECSVKVEVPLLEDLYLALLGIYDYAENEALAIDDLKDCPQTEEEAELALAAVEAAWVVIKKCKEAK